MPYMYVLYGCLIRMPESATDRKPTRPHVMRLLCMPYMYASYVCLKCMPYVYASYVLGGKPIRPRATRLLMPLVAAVGAWDLRRERLIVGQ